MMSANHICSLPRPAEGDARAFLGLIEPPWWGPAGAGELFFESHAGHVHLWLRWDGDWGTTMEPDDWEYFRRYVWPVLRECIEAVRCGEPLDATSAEMLSEIT